MSAAGSVAMRCIGWIFLLFLRCVVPMPAHADSATGKPDTVKAEATDATIHVILGESSVELTGPWRFHTGDDMAWVQPKFKDSGWDTVDLSPPFGSADASLGTSGYIP